MPLSESDLCLRVAGRERAHNGKAQIAGKISAMHRHLFALDDGKGRIDVTHIVAIGDAVEVKIDRVQPGAKHKAPRLIPFQRRFHFSSGADISHVPGEGRHVVRGIGQLKHGGADDIGGRLLLAEAAGAFERALDEGTRWCPGVVRPLSRLTYQLV